MKSRIRFRPVAICALLGTAVVIAVAQVAEFPRPDRDLPPPGNRGFGPGGPGRGGGPGFGGVQADFPLRKKFDKNGDKKLEASERKEAREYLDKERAEGRGPRRGPMFRRGDEEPREITPGEKLSPADVKTYGAESLYDPKTLRTFFLEFESSDWEQEMAAFYHTDVDLPAKLTVDGKTFDDVGVRFRGASSFFTVNRGYKRSIAIELDSIKEGQNFLGVRNIDLLNSHTDPTFLHTVLYFQIAREFIPAPRANYARLVINGESWGVYVNTEHFNKDFVKQHSPKSKGGRWKVPGSPNGQGGLEYLGEDPAKYKSIYEIKSKDDAASWRDLIRLCRVLNETSSNELQKALSEILDIDGALKFLALENALINSDGYWIRSSDYNLFQDEKGRFHIIPHDANETFAPAGGPGFRRGGGPGEGGFGVRLDPFSGADNPAKPLLHRLLAVPELRARYAGYVRQIAEEWLDWKKLGPIAESHHALIKDDIKKDTRKLASFEAFENSLTEEVDGGNSGPGPRRRPSLKSFVEQRREFLLGHPEIKTAFAK